MKVLYFSSPVEDYLSDSLLHGLRLLLGADLVDYPKCDILYKNCPAETRGRARGNGFTLYRGLLDDLEVDRAHIVDRVVGREFDLVVISDIWRQYGWFVQLRPWLDPARTVIIDGADTPQLYPYAGVWLRRPYYWLLPRAHPDFRYYKREWTAESKFSVLNRLAPALFAKVPAPKNLRTISFSIPEEKIVTELLPKEKEFPMHIVDEEVTTKLQIGKSSYAFTREADYYHDLQISRFGITTKRAGWDCLRHYEIAANGAVPCFRALDEKPATCAPHGLSRDNCVVYRDADDLLRQTRSMGDEEYVRLQTNALAWARANSTAARAQRFLDELQQAPPGAAR